MKPSRCARPAQPENPGTADFADLDSQRRRPLDRTQLPPVQASRAEGGAVEVQKIHWQRQRQEQRPYPAIHEALRLGDQTATD